MEEWVTTHGTKFANALLRGSAEFNVVEFRARSFAMQTIPTRAYRFETPAAPTTTSLLASGATYPVQPLDPATRRAADGLPPILVADDDPDDRFFIRRLISKTGTDHPVLTFDDGMEVVNYLGGVAAAGAGLRHRAPRLLFLDLKMNGLGGFGFLEWARQQKSSLPMTIVVLSNSIEPADVARAHALGAHRYLVKYPGVQTFATIIRSVYPLPVAR